MTDMTPERLAEIRARAEAATPGPWEAEDYSTDPGDEGSCITAGEPGTMRQRAVAYAIDYPWTTPESCAADATFIAHARTDVPELAAEVERLRVFIRGTRIAALTAERDALARQIERVRALHFAVVPADWLGGPTRCGGCGENYPCRTIHALDA